jgi:diguanylate cyclase (GGDEF)-like protein
MAKSVNADFLQEEMTLGLVGEQIFKDNKYKDEEKTKEIFDRLLSQNPYLVSLGLADVDGNVLIPSSNVKLKTNLNFLENEKTSSGFKESLTSDDMVVSKTYFFDTVKEWIIPLRKAIRDKDGNLLGVIVAGIKNSKNENYLDGLRLSKDKVVLIAKEFDDENKVFRLYYSGKNKISNAEIYNEAIPNKVANNIRKSLKQKYGYTIEELKNNSKVVSIHIVDSFEVKKIVGITYDKKYKLWISIEGDEKEIWNEFFDILLIYTALFILSYSVFFFLFKNIATSENRKKRELIYQAQHDILTGLPNRTFMYTNIEKWKKLHNQKYYVLYLDLDNFKNINDKFGHTVGDKILVEVAQRIERFFGTKDMLIRQGGDEFIVLKEGIDEKELEEQIQNLIALVSKTYHTDNKEFRIGMSVGIAQYTNDALNIEELLSLSDTAMYEAKKRKNSYCFFSIKMRHSNILKSDIEHELRGAIENNELWMVYQPQINSDGTLYGVEALVRWENEKLGFVGPDRFISVAEETGLMRELGEFVIATSLKDITIIQKQLGIYFNLSINISVVQLMESDFLSNLLNALEKENFSRACLTLEITESLSIESLDDVLPLLYEIQEYNIKISLDDFGTGYSSLSILRDLPINELKIDKSFIDKILYDESEKILVQSIINIGKNFNMKTLAEGVESNDQVVELKALKCDVFQGYYYSKPLTKKNLIEFLKKEKA